MRAPLLLIFCCLISFSCKKEISVTAMPSVKELEVKSGSVLGSGSRVLYHHVDNERLPGLEEWVIESSGFKMDDQPLPSPATKMFTTDYLERMLIARVPSLKFNDITHCDKTYWVISSTWVICDALYTKTKTYVIFSIQP